MRAEEYEKMFCLEDRHWWFAGKRRLARTLLDDLPPRPGRKILDVGCGTGGMFQVLNDYGSLVGLDASDLAIGFARRRQSAHLLRAALPRLPLGTASFDLVTAFDVLYHRQVGDDQLALREIARVLKPGGHLLLSEPAIELLRSAHDEAFENARRYTTGGMGRKLRAAGFAIKRLSYSNCLIFPAVASWRLVRRGAGDAQASDVRPVPPWLNPLMSGVYRCEASLLRRMDLPIGSSIIALAERLSVAADE
jgi:ubiquinone/menaquinone biosynthesis C-methylase UbiE